MSETLKALRALAVVSDEAAWGVDCENCDLLPVVVATREQARVIAREHRANYDRPKPAVRAVRVRVVMIQDDQPAEGAQ